MKKRNLFVALVLLLTVPIGKVTAQTITTMTTSSMRNLPNTADTVIKSQSIGDNKILTLVKGVSGSVGYFYLTVDGSTVVSTAQIHGEAYDFDVDTINHLLYYCGGGSQGYIAVVDISTLFTGGAVYKIDIPTVRYITKIDIAGSGLDYVSAIGTTSSSTTLSAYEYLHININTGAYTQYRSQYPLLDVVNTNSFACVLAKVSNKRFALYSHDKYTGQPIIGNIYQTATLTNYWAVDKDYVIESLSKTNSEQVVVAYASTGTTVLDIVSVDVPTMNINSTYGIQGYNVGRGAILDMKYNPVMQSLVCLFYNGATSEEIIIKTALYGNLFSPIGIVPNTVYSINGTASVFKTIAPYKNTYIVGGNLLSGYAVTWFDKFLGNALASNCCTYVALTKQVVNTVSILSTVSYTSFFGGTATVSADIPIIGTLGYNFMCQ